MTIKNNIWQQVVESLKSELKSLEIKTWFSNTSCEHVDDNIAVVIVPNKFIANWLRDNYQKNIRNAFKKIINKNPEIIFNIKIDKKSSGIPEKINKNTQTRNLSFNYLDKSMTFDNFITGEFNKFAYSSAVEISKKPGDYYNPFYIFSKHSIGKTHLLNAIGNDILKKHQFFNIIYIYSKNFINEFNYSLKINNFEKFKSKYNSIDVLLFDDIQHLSGSYKSQEELISIFDTIYSYNKQIVLTGDRPPVNLKNMSSHLISRLGSGLITEIKDPDIKAKSDVLKKYIENNKIKIPADIINYISKENKDLKTLLKNIIRIETYMSINKEKINILLIKSLIKDRYDTDITIKDIQSIASGYFKISVSDLLSNKKNYKYSYPRHMAMYLSRNFTDIPLKDIGYYFGDRDHTTVLYACRKIEKEINKKEIKEDLDNIKNLLL